MAPLLRIVPTVNKNLEVIHKIYEKTHHIPVAKRRFNSMEILLATDRGVALRLEKGNTIVTLHLEYIIHITITTQLQGILVISIEIILTIKGTPDTLQSNMIWLIKTIKEMLLDSTLKLINESLLWERL